jgi:hypothetical protein
MIVGAGGKPISTVALQGPVEASNAPRPSNDSERLLFRQVYETLVRVDCMGRVLPGLAAAWRLDEAGTSWIVTLRDAAQFSDGTPVTAADVRASWLSTRGDQLRPDVSRLVESIAVVDERVLAIRLRQRRADALLSLAHPDLGVARLTTTSPWPLGTRAARIVSGAETVASTSVITLVRDGLPAVRFLVSRGDARDLLDRGVDLLLTRDPAALDYASALGQFDSTGLAPARIHLLLLPGRARGLPSLSEEARQALAIDAIRGEARGAAGPFWWETTSDCGVVAPPARPRGTIVPRIVYDAGDPVARDLAERLVALARTPGSITTALPEAPTFQRAAGLSGNALAVARRRGTDAAYIMSVAARPLDSCREWLALLETGDWLQPDGIVPLSETRLRAIVRRGHAGLIAEWDGGLMLAPVR